MNLRDLRSSPPRAVMVAVTAAVAVALAMAAGCRRPPRNEVHAPDPGSERPTTLGKVVGFTDKEGSHAWLGIPFAEPPVGPLRWRAPAPKQPWTGTFQAVKYGRSCTQFINPVGGLDEERRGKLMGSEDCLTLNVFAPRFAPGGVPAGKDRLPVMVWIHGGANKLGAASAFGAARNLAARHGVVVVSVNYRLGVLGWFRHPALVAPDASPEERSGNFGTLDLIHALHWVRDNAASFGGDPGNVTVFGESAGAINVFSLMSSPLAKGLFHRAIAQSGLPMSSTVKGGEALVEDGGERGSSPELLVSLLLRDERAEDRAGAKAALAAMSGPEIAAYLRGKTADQLLAVLDGGAIGMYEAPALFRDGHVLPRETFLELLADASRYNAVPIIVGTNRDEAKLFMAFDPARVTRWFGVLPRIKDVAQYNLDAGYSSDFWKAAGADLPASRLRRAQGPTVWAYRFDWDEQPTRLGVDMSVLLGAAHGMEIQFVFDSADEDSWKVQTDANREGMRFLGRTMSGYWTHFARTGAPGRGPDGSFPEWKPWSDGAPDSERLLVIDTPAGGGVRMSSEQITLESLTRRLEKEPAYDGKPRDRCGAYARVLKAAERFSVPGPDVDYAHFAGGACQAFPGEMELAQGPRGQ